jgi:uncharacterized protein
MFMISIIVAIFSLVVGGIVSASVSSKMKKYSLVQVSTGLTGREMAQRMLNDNGVFDVAITAGVEGADHFDPRTNTISLSPSNYNRQSLTAAATACHEAGHALQFAQSYAPLKVRSSLVPLVNLCSNLWPIVFIIGIFLQMVNLTYAAIAVYAITLIFQVVTLPVEFNASKRGLEYLKGIGLGGNELAKSKSLLSSCAMTYVVAALASALQLLLLLLHTRQE